MEKKQKFEILLAILLIVLLVGLVWWLVGSKDDQVDPTVDEDSQVQDVLPGQEPLDLTGYEEDASTIARVFVERFGSFSNHSDYENVSSVMDIATSSLQDRLGLLVDGASADDGAVYYGGSTYVISIDQVEVTDVREVLEVMTQREESIDSPSNATVKYQTMALTLVKLGDEWFVDDFEWLD